MKSTCEKHQWKYPKQTSPLIWRELIDRGGRGTLVGGLDDFQEYAQCYYGTILDHFMSNTSALFRLIAEENAHQYTQDIDAHKQYVSETINPYYVCIMGADHPCAYALFPELLSKKIFPNRDLCLRLIASKPEKFSSVQALAMEIEDLACKQFHQIEAVSGNEQHSYEMMDFILVLDDYFSQEKEKYFDSLIAEKLKLKLQYDEANLFDDERPAFIPEKFKYDLPQAFRHYQTLANQIQSSIKPSCEILLACSNSTMVATQAFIQTIKKIPANHIIGLARNVENQAKARIGKKLQVDLRSRCLRKESEDEHWNI